MQGGAVLGDEKVKSLFVFFLLTGCGLDTNGTGIFPPPQLNITIDGSPEATPQSANSDAPPAACHSAASVGYSVVPQTCASISVEGDPRGSVTYFVNSGSSCAVNAAPVECAGCDYTCDCMLRYLAAAGGNCSCSQETVGGPILLSGSCR